MLSAVLAEVYVSEEMVVPFADKKIENGVLTDTATLDFIGQRLDDFALGLSGPRAVAS